MVLLRPPLISLGLDVDACMLLWLLLDIDGGDDHGDAAATATTANDEAVGQWLVLLLLTVARMETAVVMIMAIDGPVPEAATLSRSPKCDRTTCTLPVMVS